MSKWTLIYGMCDGTGPYTAESEGAAAKLAIHNFSLAHPEVDPCNINSVIRQPAKPSAMKECECRHWATTDIRYVNTFGHHHHCGFRPDSSSQFLIMREIVKGLTCGMEAWAHDEDGIHPDAWEAYCKAKMILGEDCDESTA